MKVKRFEIVRVLFDIETNKPIIARMIVLSKIHKLIMFSKFCPILCGKPLCKAYYRLYIPKIRFTKGGEE